MLMTVFAPRRERGLTRHALLGTAAVLGVAMSSAAQAQKIGEAGLTSISATGKIDAVLPSAQASNGVIDSSGSELAPQRLDLTLAELDPQILIANPGTPTTARDPVNITGIAQMIVDNGGGSVGLCTGTLINPRTVIFAAHCVNSRPATAYGANSGGVGIGFGFETNTRANAPGQVDELVRWLLGVNGAGRFQTNTAQAFYNVDGVAYNPRSTEPGNGFLYADIAIASLDTPAANIPTWALLFSQLPQPGAINAATGTGYHVTLAGYGGNGTGTSGTLPIDFRRRLAENWLGALTSLDNFQGFLFGSPPEGLTQNLYWIDFDDPLRGKPGASPFDFNAFRDNALPNEGTTAGGDSGGPLILDRAYARQVVIGVLSGGYTRFFTAQPANGYGTASFYQPLYLYWDYIAATNPYRYVAATAGDGNWTDPTHWVTTLDPNYTIIGPNNTLINGVPTNPGGTTVDTSGQFGQACFQNATSSDCYDFRTRTETVNGNPIGTVGNDAATVTIAGLTDGLGTGETNGNGATVQLAGLDPAADGVQTGSALPPATIANGLPGATNFVPNNLAGNRTAGVLGRYFDVTLSANGTTTLNSAVTIDRFTLNGAGARLDITSTGSLTSLIDVTQTIGTLQVNGSLTSVGDYLLMVGGVNGTGTITAPFFTSLLGVISPGASGSAGSIGTLNFRGNLILTSGNTYNLDLGANGVSDSIAVARVNGANGAANVGGNLAISYSAATLRAGNLYTILTAEGGVTGAFQNPGAISAILTPTVLRPNANTVQVAVQAGSYRSVAGSTPVQASYAALLDQNRPNAASFDSIYGPLDLQNAATIRATLDSLAPRTEALTVALGTTATDNMSRFTRDRLANLSTEGGLGGTLTMIGQPVEIAALNASGLAGGAPVASDSSASIVQEGKLPDDMSAYLAGGYIDGDSAPMAGAVPTGGRDRFNGYYIVGGIEKQVGDGVVGLSFSYSDIKGTTTVATQSARGSLYQGTLYAKADLGAGIFMDGQIGAGLFATESTRNVSIVGTPYQLRAGDNALVINGEVGAQKSFAFGTFKVDPRISVRTNYLGFSDTAETGGGPALLLGRRDYTSVQGRAGLIATTTGKIKPYVTAYYVHDFDNRKPSAIYANFVGGIGPRQAFALFSDDKNWGEVSGGLAYDTGKIELSVAADTTFGRSDVSNQSYRGSVKIRF
ncbi:MAG: hypothetical protein B7Y45_11400 [Sphingomonas sp. 28-66-16]|nr:MAG: hypothetical protein B7Y45_11400 [Sphingomonas sp. 28-66-16]